MDFFTSQEKARRRTGLLVALFALAVGLMIIAIYLATVVLLHMQRKETPVPIEWLQLDVLAIVTLAMLAVISLGSLYKIMELSAGGAGVATNLGGTLILPDTRAVNERKILNVVEEMAIASGIAVPPVYLLRRERSINAFAAGLTPDDAVIGVSQGAVDLLSRDELQGVMAHEFSHILNGDMRFNLRLMGLLHGILLVAMLGYYVLRFGGTGGGSDSRRVTGVVGIAGIVMLVFGSIGLFFSRLIKAAVSRQREYLADASAVQFTRNPEGIAGALKKIGGLSEHSYIRSPEAESASHLFFGAGLPSTVFSLFATHPPLAQRIRRIDAHFDGKYPTVRVKPPVPKSAPSAPADTPGRSRAASIPALDRLPLEPLALIAAVGLPTASHVTLAQQVLADLAPPVRDSLRDPLGAATVVFALLLDRDVENRGRQIDLLEEISPAVRQETAAIWKHIQSTERRHWLPVLEIAQGTLRNLSSPQYRQFRSLVQKLIEADKRLNLFEFALRRTLLLHLDRVFGLAKPPQQMYYATSGVRNEMILILSALAHLGRMPEADTVAGFTRALGYFDPKTTSELLPRESCTLLSLEAALDKLSQCAVPIKKKAIAAATACIAYDGTVTEGEAELLRSICGSLDCPMPPLIAGERRTEAGHESN